MIDRFQKYYDCVPFLYSIASILNSRAKLVGSKFMLKTIYMVLMLIILAILLILKFMIIRGK